MSKPRWPDALQPPQPEKIQQNLELFWKELALLADSLPNQQFLLAAEQLHNVRQYALEMMLALNGIQRPATSDLNQYLSANQRAALEKTLRVSAGEPDDWANVWIGQAVSLVVIYRWYAPQLVGKYALSYPSVLERACWSQLMAALPTWPLEITTE